MDIDTILRVIGALAAIGACVASVINNLSIKNVHVLINSRLTELMKAEKYRSFREGIDSTEAKKEQK